MAQHLTYIGSGYKPDGRYHVAARAADGALYTVAIEPAQARKVADRIERGRQPERTGQTDTIDIRREMTEF